MTQPSLTLKELLTAVRQQLHNIFDDAYWIRAEIGEIRENSNGHCYLELIEKDASDKLIVAKSKAVIWADAYRLIQPFFKEETGQDLSAGLNVLVEVSVSFHELYGFSFVIRDIDPSFTLGDLAKKRLATIRQLKEDGILEMNKLLVFPDPACRIAVISSAGAAGFGDFCEQLQSNRYGYKFYHKLFPAVMQGDGAADSIIAALDRIYAHEVFFDVVVIIRGGGAATDLLAFDEYDLAAHCAQFPLPVITGIGHERDESVTDMVAHTRCKTPTAAAAFLIEKMQESERKILQLQQAFINKTATLSKEETVHLKNLSFLILQKSSGILQQQHFQINSIFDSLKQKAKGNMLNKQQKAAIHELRLRKTAQQQIQNQRHKLEMTDKTLTLLSPENILQKGYTITAKNGKIVRRADELQTGDMIATFFIDGEKQSIIK